jgi:hypothetical protein
MIFTSNSRFDERLDVIDFETVDWQDWARENALLTDG